MHFFALEQKVIFKAWYEPIFGDYITHTEDAKLMSYFFKFDQQEPVESPAPLCTQPVPVEIETSS